MLHVCSFFTLKGLNKVNFTNMILLAFVMCFIMLMLADSHPQFAVESGRHQRHQGIPAIFGHVYVGLRKHITDVEATENRINSTKEVSSILRAGGHGFQTGFSRNWTETVKQWQKEIHHRDYNYQINNLNLCKGLSDQRIVILVYSATSNAQKRSALRETWADPRVADKKRFTVVFLLGETNDENEQKLISAESEKYQDVVQGDFLDTYHNLTHKGLFGFQWVRDFCQNARLVLKVDDDVFLDIFKILDTYADESYERGQLACQVREIGNSPILREGKWKLDEKYFPGETSYTFRHCNGYFVMMSLDVVKQLLAVSEKEPKIWIDDVYLFGILPSKLDSVNMTQLINVLSLYEDNAMACFQDVSPCRLLSGYTYNQGSIQKLWRLALMNSFTFTGKYGNLAYVFMKLLNS